MKSEKWNSARRLAGAMGYLGLAGGERVEIAPFAYQVGESFGPTQGKRQAVRMLEFVASVTPAGPPQSRSESHLYGGLLVVISDLLDTATTTADMAGNWEQLAEGLRFFPSPRWQVLVLHLLSESEVHPTLEGDFDLKDMETGESLPFHLDETTLAQYRLRVRRWCAEVQSACSRRAATYARVMAEWPFEQAVVPYLRQRGAIH